MTRPPCPRCDHTHAGDWATVVGRFAPDGPHGYQSTIDPDAPLRDTREQAVRDGCDHWAKEHL